MDFTSHGFFSNFTGIDCVVCSVANLILKKFNDLEMATKFYENVYDHELVNKKQIRPYLLPFLIEDITENKYSATLFLDDLDEYQSLQENLTTKVIFRRDLNWQFIDEVVKYSVSFRKIVPGLEVYPEFPFVGIFQTGFEKGHAVVDLGDKVINDGYKVNWVEKPKFLYSLRIGKLQKIEWTSLNQIPL